MNKKEWYTAIGEMIDDNVETGDDISPFFDAVALLIGGAIAQLEPEDQALFLGDFVLTVKDAADHVKHESSNSHFH